MEPSDAHAARALLDQLMSDRATEKDGVAPPETAMVSSPAARRPLPPPARDPSSIPVPPAPAEGREYHVTHQAQVCSHCGATLSGALDWCERCLTPL